MDISLVLSLQKRVHPLVLRNGQDVASMRFLCDIPTVLQRKITADVISTRTLLLGKERGMHIILI